MCGLPLTADGSPPIDALSPAKQAPTLNVILLGPPGSGKGTQGRILAQRLGIPLIATADLLSDAVERDTEIGRQAKLYMDQGSMVPDEIVMRLVSEQLESPAAAGGVILDGFPRSIRQAEAIDRLLAAQDEAGRTVLLFDVPEEELVRRLLTRASATPGSEESPEAIRRRLDLYRRSTAPLVGYYRELGVLTIVPGTGPVEDVAEAVRRIVGR
jgi:adenylate kinase